MATPRTGQHGYLALQIGIGLFAVGAIGDIVYHALPQHVAHALEPLLGVDGYRAHALTLAGMLVVVLGLVLKGVHGMYHNRSR
jgi:hypothetical protein